MTTYHVSRRRFMQLVGGLIGAAATSRFAGLVSAQGVTQDVADIIAGLQPASSDNLALTGELNFWDWTYDARAEYFDALIDAWTAANPDIDLVYTSYPYGDLQTRLLTSASAGSNPPFSNVHVNWRFELQKAGRLVPYPADLFDFDKLISTNFNRDPETGNIYTTVFNYYGDIVFYNRDILEAEGLTADDIPTNWDDFLALSRQLTLRDDRGLVTRPGCALNHYYSQEWLWTSMIYQQGGFLYNEAGDQALWNSEEGVRALDIIRQWFNEEPIDDYNLLRHYEQFTNGEAAMFISHGYWATDIPRDFPDLNWGTVPIPTFTGEALPSWGMALPEEGLAVFDDATEEEQAAAFSFIKYVLGPDEHRLGWAQVMTGPPDNRDLLDAPVLQENDPYSVIDSLAQTLPYRIIYGERPTEAEALFRTMFEQVIINNQDAQTAADTATEQMNQILAESDTLLITERNYVAPDLQDEDA